MRRFMWVPLALMVSVTALVATPAAADSNFHTQRIPLTPVGDAPLDSGFVVDIHTNGPQVFAIERYVLVGAASDTTYQVSLQVFGDSAGCTAETKIITVSSATVQTNAAGNGSADFVFRPADVPHNATIGIVWEFTHDGIVVYRSACIAVTTD